MLTNGLVLYQPLISDVFLYDSTLTLVYGIGDFSGLIWKYSANSDLSNPTNLTATYTNSEIGFTSLTVDNSMQGYYFYELNSVISPMIGLYDESLTTGWSIKILTYMYVLIVVVNISIYYIRPLLVGNLFQLHRPHQIWLPHEYCHYHVRN